MSESNQCVSAFLVDCPFLETPVNSRLQKILARPQFWIMQLIYVRKHNLVGNPFHLDDIRFRDPATLKFFLATIEEKVRRWRATEVIQLHKYQTPIRLGVKRLIPEEFNSLLFISFKSFVGR